MPAAAVLSVNATLEFVALIVTSAVEYIAPPFPVALLFVKFESVIVRFAVLYIAPPFPVALLFSNIASEIAAVPALYIAPPFAAVLPVNVARSVPSF